jgi:hypothetical protein
MAKSIIVLGGPDSGKSNYLGRLWHALDTKSGRLVAVGIPPDLSFPMDTAEHLFKGHFAPHTGRGDSRRDLDLTVRYASGGGETRLVVPDFSGELWTTAVRDSEIAAEWMDELENADGALLFVRVDSDQNKKPLDWVTSSKYLRKVGQDDEEWAAIPAQVLLCELIRFLEHTMSSGRDRKPRLSIVVAAWDRVGEDIFAKGPLEYLRKEYPMFGGRLDDLETLDTRVFGVSIVGGDLNDDPDFRAKFLDEGIDGKGWVAVPGADGVWVKDPDLSAPLAWAMGG